MKKTGWLVLVPWLMASVCSADEFEEPGWFNAGGLLDVVETTATFASAPAEDWQEGGQGARWPGGSPSSVAETITPEIEALARGLENDPKRIFDFVHDHIRHVFYFGSKKGAQLTLLERSGNDFDQCALLMALLRSAGYTNSVYQFSLMLFPVDSGDHKDLRHWLQLSLVNTNWTETKTYFNALLTARGYPILAPIDTNHLAFHHLWLRLTLGGTNYFLDPSFKIHDPITNIDLVSAMGLSTNSLWNAADGTVTADYVTNLNETGLTGELTKYTTNLLGTLRSNYPNASVEEILGGWRIVSSRGIPFSQTTTFPVATNGVIWSNLPTDWMTKLTVSFGGSSKQWFTPELQAKRLSLTFNASGLGQLWLDDTEVFSQSTTGSGTVDVSMRVEHPHGNWDATNNNVIAPFRNGHSVTNSYQRTNASYAILYSFEASTESLRRRQEQLDSYWERGLADTSREIVTETLNVMGLNWLLQTELAERTLATQLNCLGQYHHRFGRMAQEQGKGYYIDVYLQLSGIAPSGGAAPEVTQRAKYLDAAAYLLSALEHGLIEQLQSSNLLAASTVKMLQLANTNGQPIYLVSSNNWSGVRNQLLNYDLATLDDFITQGATLLLPRNGSNHLAGAGSWAGYGLVKRRSLSGGSIEMTMLIEGAYHGGYVSFPSVTVNPPFVYQFNYVQPTAFDLASPYVPFTSGADPVNMADGAFTVQEADLSVGQPEPRGLSLRRTYTSSRRRHDLAGLARGWTHNYYFDLTEVSAPQAGLGQTTPAQMAPMIVATRAAIELYKTQPDAKTWAMTALIAKWGVDQVVNKAVSVTLGDDIVQFVKQPDGTFTPPAGSTMTLLNTNATYWVQERHGNTFKFDGLGRLTNIVDQYNQPLIVSYLSSTSNLPETVTDWKSRTLTFNYTNNRLTSVTDSTGRTVSYGYTNSYNTNGDLISVTDAENKTHTFIYDTNHQILAAKNALGQTVSSNVYDAFGQVITQYSQGDTNQTFQLYWSGWENVEQDPAGGKRRFSYDDKHRLIAFRDALSNVSQTFYDGQDHVIMTISPLSETNRFEFDGRHNLLRSVDALTVTNRFFYDAQDHLTNSVDARGNASYFAYNAQHSLTGSTNGAGDWAAYLYNSDGTLATNANAGGSTRYSYDSTYGQLNLITYPGNLGSEGFLTSASGDVLSHTNARQFVTSFQYNQRRELTNAVAPTNITTSVGYDAAGNVQSRKDARGFTATNSWSATRKLLVTALPGTPQGTPLTTNVYDNRDLLMRNIQNPASSISATTTFTNDAAQRLISVTDPLLRTTRFGYDGVGRQTAATNAVQEVTRQEWNKRGELTNLIDAAMHTIKRGYDTAGNQTTLTNRNTNRWQFYFDAANRLTNTITPTGKETRLSYDARGLLYTALEPSTQGTTNYYDAKGRLTNRVDGVASTTYRYDVNDNLTNLFGVPPSGGSATNTWTYDAYDRVSSYKDADGNTISYRYDANGNLTNLIYPGNRTVTYAYDSLNRLTNVTDWASRKTRFEYDLASRLKKITRPNGTLREINYDVAGQTTNIVEKLTNNAPIAFFMLSNNAAGRVAWEFAAPLPHAYPLPTRTMAFDLDNRLTNFNSSAVTQDADGNMTYGPLTNSTLTNFNYDARNRLTNVAGVSYAYDPAGNRTGVSNATGVATFVINPNAALSQVLMRVRSGVTNYYIYGLGLLYEVTETASTTNTATYHYDIRGSTIALTDGSGLPTPDRIEYSPYGSITYRAGTNDTAFLYNGRYGVQTDPNGLLYMRARYYNPYLCRFINADPTGFSAGLNFYAYADGNPVSMIDPFGLGAVGASSGGSWLNNLYDWVGNSLLGPVDYGDGSISFDPADFARGLDNHDNWTAQEQLRTDVGRMVVTTAAALIPYERVAGALLGGGRAVTAARSIGSGPARGFLEVSDSYASSRAVQNFGSPRPTDFIFDAQSERFIMGRGPLGHDSVLQAGRISPTETTVGGRIFRQDGRLMTDEWSGHYGQNWTPELREQFQNFMQQHGVNATHTPWP